MKNIKLGRPASASALINKAVMYLGEIGGDVWKEVKTFEWIQLNNIMKFIQLYIWSFTILGIFLACGFISIFPNVKYKILAPTIVLDIENFYKYLGNWGFTMPESLSSAIGENKPSLILIDEPNIFSTQEMFETIFTDQPKLRLFDVIHGIRLVSGVASDMGRTTEFVKKQLGITGSKNNKKNIVRTMNYERLRNEVWIIAQSTVRELFSNKGQDRSISLLKVSNIIDSISDDEEKRQIYLAFFIAQDVISFLVFENDSNLLVKNLKISLDDAGRTVPVEPKFIATFNDYKINYNFNSRIIELPELAPMDAVVLITKSKSVIQKSDINISWEKYADIDRIKLRELLAYLSVCPPLIILIHIVAIFIKKKRAPEW